jgi:hypothetical protein
MRVTGQFLEPDPMELACQVLDRDDLCGRRQTGPAARLSTTPQLAHEAFAWRPTILRVTVRLECSRFCGLEVSLALSRRY